MGKNFHKNQRVNSTSWQKSSTWYNQLVGEKGHYYHQQIVLPGVLQLLNIDSHSSVLDVGCGQGIFARQLPNNYYTGIDLSPDLIRLAKQQDKNPTHSYLVSDATKSFSLENKKFSHAVAILSLQNMEKPELAIKNTANSLHANGKFVIVLNHPCFRIPRQSGWGISENKVQYRYENIYMSHLKIPITIHPGDTKSEITWSFHYPLSYFSHALSENGFVIEKIEEWTSNKESSGKVAKMENRARSEIPLFLTLSARKTPSIT